MSDNQQQIEYWNGAPGERWAGLFETTERSMTFITSALMPFAGAKPGEHVLDIGCGCGSTTIELAKVVGGTGAVVAVDVSQPMLNVARERAKQAGVQIQFLEADASIFPFNPEFALVFSRFGVMFFADPESAFANIRKALRPGGRLAFVCWRALLENVWAAGPLAAARDLLPPQEAVDPYAPGPFAFADSSRLLAILGRAGFQKARADALDTLMRMGVTLDDAVLASLSIGPLSRAASEVDELSRARIYERVREVLAAFKTPAGIAPPAACWLVSAQA